ncbi:MAG: hypothetical protein D6785_00345 [Planctomycetota bacterium]|nr:MAG: hypothetical protein D6785_00345 [Planctomycetota bacterium]
MKGKKMIVNLYFNFDYNSKKRKNKPEDEKPIKFTIFLYPRMGIAETYPAYMDSLEEERGRDFEKYIEAYGKKGGGL